MEKDCWDNFVKIRWQTWEIYLKCEAEVWLRRRMERTKVLWLKETWAKGEKEKKVNYLTLDNQRDQVEEAQQIFKFPSLLAIFIKFLKRSIWNKNY